MTRTIWKYHVPFKDWFKLSMPDGAEILSVQMQGDLAFIWALVNPAAPLGHRYFRLAGTGDEIEEDKLSYVGTYQERDGSLVWHLFEMEG